MKNEFQRSQAGSSRYMDETRAPRFKGLDQWELEEDLAWFFSTTDYLGDKP